APACDGAPAGRGLAQERQPGLDLGARRSPVRPLRAGMRRDDVPEQDYLLEPELGEHAMDDRRRRLRRPGARELTLRRERQAGDARAAIACSLADEDQGRVTPA